MGGMRTCLLLTLALVSVGSPAYAQDGAGPQPAGHAQAITGNPLGLLVGWYNLEYERRAGESRTWGVTASVWSPWFDDYLFDDVHYGQVTAVARFYPQGKALHGFFMGAKAGVHHVWVSDDDDAGTFFSAGLDLGYNWRQGRDGRFVTGIGVGAQRVFGLFDGRSAPVINIRLNVGYGF